MVIVACILGTGCQSTARLAPDGEGETTGTASAIDRKVWFEAVDAGDADVIQALLEDGMDPLIERQGLTALHIAAWQGDLDVARLLVDAGVDVNLVPSPAEAAFASAAGHGNPRMLEMLAGADLDPDAITSISNRRSPLNLAVENGHLEMAALLIDAGADPDAHGEWYNPLHSAILFGDVGVVKLLLDNGARLDTRIRVHDRSKFSGFRHVGPVELARIIERDDIAEVLQHHGARQ
jgi:ankyrin repeat protein